MSAYTESIRNIQGHVWFCLKLLLVVVTASQSLHRVLGQLDVNYYVTSCPNVENIVSGWLTANVFTDPTGPAALVRLIFHDCQVGGCDGSILLDTQTGVVSELTSDANFGIRDLRFIDSIKFAVELACPNVVSCSDILAMAARDCVSITQGPYVRIPLGRKDGRQASNLDADRLIPRTDISVDTMLSQFAQMGMTTDEAVAILGAHTIGVGHCVNVLDRLYPTMDPNVQPFMAGQMVLSCPFPSPQFLNNNTILANDLTNLLFDNQYFRDVQSGRGLFKIDSNMAYHPLTAPIVNRFASDQTDFFNVFTTAFVKLTSYQVLTGSAGEVRRNCHMVN